MSSQFKIAGRQFDELEAAVVNVVTGLVEVRVLKGSKIFFPKWRAA
jgi:hypothetical protein